MIRDYEQRLIAKSESFGLHSSRHHLKSFTCTDCVCQQRIAAVQNVCNRIFLMFTEFDFRVHTVENNVASVVLTGSYAVELIVIHLREFFSAGRVSPYPVLKALLYEFLLCLCDCRFLFIENGFLFAFLIFYIVKDSDIFQVQCFLNYLICVDTGSAVCAVRFNIGTVIALSLNVPFSGKLRVVNLDIPLCIAWGVEKLKHKLLEYFGWNPSRTEPYGNLACRQILWLNLFKCLHIDGVIFGIQSRRPFGCRQLLTNIARQIFVCHQIFRLIRITVLIKRI